MIFPGVDEPIWRLCVFPLVKESPHYAEETFSPMV